MNIVIRLNACLVALSMVFCFGLWQQAEAETRPEARGERSILLWPDGAPGAIGSQDEDQPALHAYLPAAAKATGAAVVICPGGGYTQLDLVHEGAEMAQWLNTLGVAAFVLKYRVGPRYQHPAMFHDGQRAVRMGFSAGGHLASTVATHFDAGNSGAADPIERVSSRPDFLVLGYPVISFTSEYSHRGSRAMALGGNPDPRLAESLSNEKHVTPQTPPTFLFHMTFDKIVPAENSVLFYLALRKAGVPAELHIYEKGNHGCALARTDPVLSSWTARLTDWLKGRRLLTRTNTGNNLGAKLNE
jgi:acetyl esterase/lipase